MSISHLVVVAAVIEQADRFLLTRRLAGTHLEGCWEFPGGKCEPGEALEECLRRELREELAVEVEIAGELLEIVHDYADRSVQLHFFRCTLLGTPHPQLGQAMRWVHRSELATLDLPAADARLVEMLSMGTSGER